MTVVPLTIVVKRPLTALTVVPVKVTALTVEPSIAPPVMLVPLIVPETVAFCCTSNAPQHLKANYVKFQDLVAFDLEVLNLALQIDDALLTEPRGRE